MNLRSLAETFIVAASVLLLTACVGPSSPAQPPSGATARGGETVSAPRVERPIDAAGLAACDLLQDAQVIEVSLDPSTATDQSNQLATACSWESSRDSTTLTLTLNVRTTLDLLYGARDLIDEFHEFTLEGFPAVREGAADALICTVYAALADTQVLSVEVSVNSPEQRGLPCQLAERGAEAVIDTLRSRS